MAPHHTHTGISIIQIICALALICLIAIIIFPLFEKVREPLHESCQANMMQLDLAYVQYSQDYDQTFPSGINTIGNGWAGQLHSFTKSNGVYQCPQDTHDGSYISYAENRSIVGQHLKKFTDPASTVQLYETTTLNCDPSTHETVSTTGLSAPPNSTRHDSPQTRFELNFGFADGHVKMLTPGQVSGGPNAVPPKNKGSYMATFAIK